MTHHTSLPEVITVAFADDHTLLRETTNAFLQSRGDIRVPYSFDSGQALLEALKQAADRELPHICLVDVSMPGMDGFELVAALRTGWPDIKVIVLSGHEHEESVLRMIHLGAHGYMTKRIHPVEIRKAIISICREQEVFYTSLFTPLQVRRATSGQDQVVPVTYMELEILKCSVRDMSYSDMARKMNVSYKQIEGCCTRLYQKLGVDSRVGLVLYALRCGYARLEPL